MTDPARISSITAAAAVMMIRSSFIVRITSSCHLEFRDKQVKAQACIECDFATEPEQPAIAELLLRGNLQHFLGARLS